MHLVDDNVSHRFELRISGQPLQQDSRRAECQSGIAGHFTLKSYLITDCVSCALVPLGSYSLGNSDGAYPPRLGTNYFHVILAFLRHVDYPVVQDKLRHLEH